MTNEEIAEEILYEAFEKGFIDQLRKEIDNIKTMFDNYTPHSELVYIAHQNLKKHNIIQ